MGTSTRLKIAAAYIRVSTEDQVEYSPEAQLVEIRKYAAANGYLLPEDFIFVDEGISGKKTVKRNNFNRMIGVAKTKPKPFDAILLWKFSRFARNREDSVVYKSMLRKQLGIEVISVSEPVGDDKMSVIIEALIEAMDEYYSINLAEEVKRGMSEKARRGELQTMASYGYRVEDNVLVPVPEEAALIREIFAAYLNGEGLSRLAKWMNAQGKLTHRGNPFENRTIEYILRNPVYIGKLRWNPTGRTRRDFDNENIILSDAQHEPLIDEATWDAVQERLRKQKALTPYHGRPTYDRKDWLSGIVRCAACGSTLIFAKPYYFKCNNYVRGRCEHAQHIKTELLHQAIIDRLSQDCFTTRPLSCKITRQTAPAMDETAALERALDSIRRKKERLRDAYLNGVETVEEYARMKQSLDQEETSLTQRMTALAADDAASDSGPLLRSRISDTLETLLSPDADIEQKYIAVNSIIERCTFSKEENLLSITYRLVF